MVDFNAPFFPTDSSSRDLSREVLEDIGYGYVDLGAIAARRAQEEDEQTSASIENSIRSSRDSLEHARLKSQTTNLVMEYESAIGAIGTTGRRNLNRLFLGEDEKVSIEHLESRGYNFDKFHHDIHRKQAMHFLAQKSRGDYFDEKGRSPNSKASDAANHAVNRKRDRFRVLQYASFIEAAFLEDFSNTLDVNTTSPRGSLSPSNFERERAVSLLERMIFALSTEEQAKLDMQRVIEILEYKPAQLADNESDTMLVDLVRVAKDYRLATANLFGSFARDTEMYIKKKADTNRRAI